MRQPMPVAAQTSLAQANGFAASIAEVRGAAGREMLRAILWGLVLFAKQIVCVVNCSL
jgi:hypothetical protein